MRRPGLPIGIIGRTQLIEEQRPEKVTDGEHPFQLNEILSGA